MITKKEWMKAYKGLKPWSLFFDLNGFTHNSLALKQITFE